MSYERYITDSLQNPRSLSDYDLFHAIVRGLDLAKRQKHEHAILKRRLQPQDDAITAQAAPLPTPLPDLSGPSQAHPTTPSPPSKQSIPRTIPPVQPVVNNIGPSQTTPSPPRASKSPRNVRKDDLSIDMTLQACTPASTKRERRRRLIYQGTGVVGQLSTPPLDDGPAPPVAPKTPKRKRRSSDKDDNGDTKRKKSQKRIEDDRKGANDAGKVKGKPTAKQVAGPSKPGGGKDPVRSERAKRTWARRQAEGKNGRFGEVPKDVKAIEKSEEMARKTKAGESGV